MAADKRVRSTLGGVIGAHNACVHCWQLPYVVVLCCVALWLRRYKSNALAVKVWDIAGASVGMLAMPLIIMVVGLELQGDLMPSNYKPICVFVSCINIFTVSIFMYAPCHPGSQRRPPNTTLAFHPFSRVPCSCVACWWAKQVRDAVGRLRQGHHAHSNCTLGHHDRAVRDCHHLRHLLWRHGSILRRRVAQSAGR